MGSDVWLGDELVDIYANYMHTLHRYNKSPRLWNNDANDLKFFSYISLHIIEYMPPMLCVYWLRINRGRNAHHLLTDLELL